MVKHCPDCRRNDIKAMVLMQGHQAVCPQAALPPASATQLTGGRQVRSHIPYFTIASHVLSHVHLLLL